MTRSATRREFLRDLGLGTAALPFLLNLPGLGFANQRQRKQRLIVMFSPNGVVPSTFWPAGAGEQFTFKESLKPLEPYRSRTLVLKGLCERIRGDGDNHMRGIGGLLTGIDLFPGNLQGMEGAPAGWSRGISIDQEIKNFLQRSPETRTRFGSLEFGVLVPNRADTWTRLVYEGPNRPIAPIDSPARMFAKLYGGQKDKEDLASVLDQVRGELSKVRALVGKDDQRILDEHATRVRELEQGLQTTKASPPVAIPRLEPGIREESSNMPALSKMQIDLLVSSLAADFTRVATLQYSCSVGQTRMRWLNVDEGHHELSHAPDDNTEAQEKLTRVDTWYCEQLAYLVKRLAETPEPGGGGSLLDNTLVIWTNELGKGNTHTLEDIPFVLVGNGLNFRMGRALTYPQVPHNRLLLALAHGMGHRIDRFGDPNHCGDGVLSQLRG